jgi:hypothetical protein
MFRILFLIIVVFFNACGYKPSSYYSKQVLGENIYADVKISIKDPENSVLIKDAINEAILSRFKGKITSHEEFADSKLYIELSSITFAAINYDKNGYAIAYKAKATLKIEYVPKNSSNKKSLSVWGDYDFPIEANSVISDTKRFEAIKFASLKAIDEFISQISIKGIKGNTQ